VAIQKGRIKMHYRQLLDPNRFLNESDFTPQGREVVISRVVREDLPEKKGEAKTGAPMMYFVGKDGKTEHTRVFKVPKTVMYGLSLVYGTEVDNWKGQRVHIFSTRCMAFGEIEPCLRIKFDPEIDQKIRKWLRKRGGNVNAYMIEEK